MLDGEVREIKVEDDSPVKKGQLLVVEESRELEKELVTTRGELLRTEAEIRLDAGVNRSTTMTKSPKADRNQQVAQLSQLEEERRQPARSNWNCSTEQQETARDHQPDRRPGGRVALAGDAARPAGDQGAGADGSRRSEGRLGARSADARVADGLHLRGLERIGRQAAGRLHPGDASGRSARGLGRGHRAQRRGPRRRGQHGAGASRLRSGRCCAKRSPSRRSARA